MRWTWIQRSDLQRSLDDPFFHLVRLLSPFIGPFFLYVIVIWARVDVNLYLFCSSLNVVTPRLLASLDCDAGPSSHPPIIMNSHSIFAIRFQLTVTLIAHVWFFLRGHGSTFLLDCLNNSVAIVVISIPSSSFFLYSFSLFIFFSFLLCTRNTQ